jgi:two-component system, response regulator PdtaR
MLSRITRYRAVSRIPDKRILIVEDEAISVMTLEDSLHEMGYSVVGNAANAGDAIKLAEEFRPDLILMDIHIQGDMDGIETAELINSRFHIPVIYLTAHSDEKTIERATKTMPYGYLIKPFRMKEMYSTIEIALYKHRIMHPQDTPETHEIAGEVVHEPLHEIPIEKIMLDTIGMPVFVLSRDMRLVYYNAPLERFFENAGCLDARLRRSVFEIAPSSIIGLPKDYREVLETRKPARLLKTLIIDDRKMTFAFSLVPLLNGDSSDYVGVIIKDISREHVGDERMKEMFSQYETLLTKVGGIMRITMGSNDPKMKEISGLISEIVIIIAKMDPHRFSSG